MDNLYSGFYLIDGIYRGNYGGGPPSPPIPSTYFVLQVPNKNNPIDSVVIATKYENTFWLDNKIWNDDQYYYDVWNLESTPSKYWVNFTYTNEPPDIDKPSNLQYYAGDTVYIGTQIIPGTTVIRDGYKYVFIEYIPNSSDVEIIHGDTIYDYHFIMPAHDVILNGIFSKTPIS